MEPDLQIAPNPSRCRNGHTVAIEFKPSERLQGRQNDNNWEERREKVLGSAAKESQKTKLSLNRDNNSTTTNLEDDSTAICKSLKRKGIRASPSEDLAFPSTHSQMEGPQSTARSLAPHLASPDSVPDEEPPRSPSAAKRWVIGPLFHSFKSKMASFTEIVMSPVRLFKPTDSLLSESVERPEEDASGFARPADNDTSSTHVLKQESQLTNSQPFDVVLGDVSVVDNTQTRRDLELKRQVKPQAVEENAVSTSRLTRRALLRGSGQSSSCEAIDSSNSKSLHASQLASGLSAAFPAHQQTRPRCIKMRQSEEGDGHQDVQLSRLSGASVFDTPPDSFSTGDEGQEEEEQQEDTPIGNPPCRTSPRKPLQKSSSITIEPCRTTRANSGRRAAGRKVTFQKEQNGKSEKNGSLGTSCMPDEDQSCQRKDHLPEGVDTLTLQPQAKLGRRTRKAPISDPDWELNAKRSMRSSKGETVPRQRRGRKEDVAKECLSAWLENSPMSDISKNTQPQDLTPATDLSTSVIGKRLTRGQVNSKQIPSTPEEGDSLNYEYTDCFTDSLAVSFYTDRSANDKSSNAEDNVTDSDNNVNVAKAKLTSQKPRHQSDPKVSSVGDSNQATSAAKEAEESPFLSPNMENSVSLFNSSTLSQSICKSGRSSKRRLMKRCAPRFGDELPDDDSSASMLRLDGSVIDFCVAGEKKWAVATAEPARQDTPAATQEKSPSKKDCPKPLKRKSSPLCLSAKERRVEGAESDGDDQSGSRFGDMDILPEAAASSSSSSALLRSYSCPEIASLSLHSDTWRSTPRSGQLHQETPSHLPSATHKRPAFHRSAGHPHIQSSPSKRTRRHTVCSLEIEREIAPLCLRKEVYPAVGGRLYVSPTHPLCPGTAAQSTSFTALVSTFLSSPLAFLSRRSDRLRRKALDSEYPPSSSHYSTSPLRLDTSLSHPASSLAIHPSLAGSCSALATSSSESPECSSQSQGSSEGEEDSAQQSEDGEESTCALGLPATEIPEEKALSDSEIKMDLKQIDQRKVSSIRIRKTLPKPLNNLTPMGLPKRIRPKKKDFSVEEIYTNKNFTKPAEGRLETIFEVPLQRRDGSQCLLGQRRVKRFVEFIELGQARKVRKSSVGTGASAGVCSAGPQKKSAGVSSGGRPRRGAWAVSRQDDVLQAPEDLDSLLCSKLDLLDAFMAGDPAAL